MITRAGYLRLGLMAGLTARETMSETPGLVYDLLEQVKIERGIHDADVD